jgi:hypothetical protein
MPVLDDAARQAVADRFMRETSDLGEQLGPMLKADIRAAVNAQDDWRIANAAEANQALPPAFRQNATTAQKSRLLTLILAAAYQDEMLGGA